MRKGSVPLGVGLVAMVLLAGNDQAQTAPKSSTLVVRVREVTVDVAVYDGNGYFSRGTPISGLSQEDFEVLEDGKLQTIRSFEEHKGHRQPDVTKIKPAAGEKDEPSTETSSEGALTVILLDLASTDFEAQPWMLGEMRRFLQAAPPTSPVALFALSPGLRVLHGFTTDKAKLLEAMINKTNGFSVTRSPFLESANELDLESRPAAIAREAEQEHPTASGSQMSGQLERFQAGMLQVQAMQRTSNTLNAFQQIAHYLAVFPGRKNLIWLGTSFTDRPFGLDTEPDPEFRKTADLLQAARIAVYPIDNGGLSPGNATLAAPSVYGTHDAAAATSAQNSQIAEAALLRNGFHGTLDEIAERTGGEAYYNTNGLAWAMDRVVDQANDYYSFVYTRNGPPDEKGYRKIQVRLKHHPLLYRLSYRRGYFADALPATEMVSAENNPLTPLMDPNLPPLSQIVFKMTVRPATETEVSHAVQTGDTRKALGPRTRFTCNLAVSMADLKFRPADDGLAHGDFVLDLIAYNEQGKAIGGNSHRFSPALKPAAYAQFQRVGMQLSEQLDLPKGKYFLRAGILDLNSKKVGSLDTLVDNTP